MHFPLPLRCLFTALSMAGTTLVPGQIFVTSPVDELIETANLDGSGHRVFLRMDQTRLGPSNYEPTSMVATADTLFWADRMAESIFACNLDETDVRRVTRLSWGDSQFSSQLAAGSSKLFWMTGGGNFVVTSVDMGGHPVEQLVEGVNKFGRRGLAVSDETIYWNGHDDFNQDGVREYGIFASGLDGFGTERVVTLNELGTNGIAVSDTRLFWTIGDLISDGTPGGSGGPAPDYIYSAGLDGSIPRLLISLQRVFGRGNYVPTEIAVHGSDLFWVDVVHDAVYTAGQDGSNPRKLFDLIGDGNTRHITVVPPPRAPVRILGITHTAQSTIVRWESVPGQRYAVQKSPDMRFWLTFEGDEPAVGEEESFRDSYSPEGTMFYRVIEVD